MDKKNWKYILKIIFSFPYFYQHFLWSIYRIYETTNQLSLAFKYNKKWVFGGPQLIWAITLVFGLVKYPHTKITDVFYTDWIQHKPCFYSILHVNSMRFIWIDFIYSLGSLNLSRDNKTHGNAKFKISRLVVLSYLLYIS